MARVTPSVTTPESSKEKNYAFQLEAWINDLSFAKTHSPLSVRSPIRMEFDIA